MVRFNEIASALRFKQDDAWQAVLADELMEKSAITPRTLSILKGEHENCDPNILMNLRHEFVKRMSYKVREPIGDIMEVARRNLKTEYKSKVSGAMTKKLMDSEVEKFKQQLAHLKRINASSNKLPIARKPSVRMRFQKITIRSRSCGSNVVKARRKGAPEFGSTDNVNLPETNNPISDLPPSLPTKLNGVTGSSSLESLNSEKSLPAVYGNSLCGTGDTSQRGPNTTPIFVVAGTEKVHGDECLADFPSPPPEPPVHLSSSKLPYHCANHNPQLNEDATDDTSLSKTQEKGRKVRNSVYKQFLSYVCSKSVRINQLKNATSGNKILPVVDEVSGPQRDEKIALVLEYLQRKKMSPNSSASKTALQLQPVIKSRSKSAQALLAVSVDPSGGPFVHRFQAQRDLIKQQKMQLEEQQKKIEELTLQKLQEEANGSHKNLQKCIDELEEYVRPSMRPQLKSLKAAGMQPDLSTAGKIVERMEKRAKEREENKQLAAERRKLMEEEKKRKMAEEEEKRRKEEEAKKREAFEKSRQEKVRQREFRERVRKEQERMFNLHQRAEKYNEVRLCKTAFRAFKKLLILRDELTEKAQQYHERKILKRAFLAWKERVTDEEAHKLTVADSFYKKVLMKNSFHAWKKELVDSIRKRQVADDMYELRLQERIFRHWSKYVHERHMEMAERLEMAEASYRRELVKKAFRRWRAYPEIAHLEREKEQRKAILRQKVKAMLSDFRPVSPNY